VSPLPLRARRTSSGLHFFSPANVKRLMEVVRGKVSAIEALATGLAVGRKLKKLPVLTGYTFGFVGNRLYAAYRGQCEFMVEEGAAPEQVDAALEAFGFAMGPFAVADLSGLDIAWRMRQAQAAKRDPAARSVQIADRRCAGRLGRKTGAGYYQYPKDASRPQVDLAVPELIAKARSDKGITPRELGAEEIQRRMMLTLVNEAALLLAEGVAERATEVDVVSVNGYGFPRREGGPVFSARARRVAALQADLDELAAWSGPGFIRGDVQHLLESKA
jgi:3-hydroxyacyl-CoA dehydrogenase